MPTCDCGAIRCTTHTDFSPCWPLCCGVSLPFPPPPSPPPPSPTSGKGRVTTRAPPSQPSAERQRGEGRETCANETGALHDARVANLRSLVPPVKGCPHHAFHAYIVADTASRGALIPTHRCRDKCSHVHRRPSIRCRVCPRHLPSQIRARCRRRARARLLPSVLHERHSI